MNYQKRFLDRDILKTRLSELKKLGLKSVICAGEGEPLLHDCIADIGQHSHDIGIDTAITSNGAELNKMLAQASPDILSVIQKLAGEENE